MQGFNMGRYRPADVDPRRQPFNATHPLGKRARKLTSEGILVVRFELPFRTLCTHCNNHLAQGTRFNAQKKQVGEYMSSKIWQFTCRCTHCSSLFQIRTDPRRAKYQAAEGCRERLNVDSCSPDPNYLPESNEDSFTKLDREKKEENKAKQTQQRLLQLQVESNLKWKDPYTLNSQLRCRFRREKRKRTQQFEHDLDLKQRIGWNQEKALLPPSTPSTTEREKDHWKTTQSNIPKQMRTDKEKVKLQNQTPAQKLHARLLANSRNKSDPFLHHISNPSPSQLPSTKQSSSQNK